MSKQTQYFLHITNDHRVSKNKLEDEVRKYIREKYDHTLTGSRNEAISLIRNVVEVCNGKFPRCKALTHYFQDKRDIPGSNAYVGIPGLMTVNFYEVKEVSNG